MKYYKLHNQTDKIDDRYWPHLVANEPTVVELTQQEYENDRGIKQPGAGSKSSKDVGQLVGKDPAKKAGTSFSGENTKKEIIAEVIRRGTDLTEPQLKQHNKTQLLAML